MVNIRPKDSRGSRCLKDMMISHELSPQSPPQTDDTEILPQTQATTPSELVQSESTVKVEEADELLMKTGATETGLQPSQSSDRLVSLSGAPESDELQMEPDSTKTEPLDVSHSDRLLSLSLVADAYLAHGASIDDVLGQLGITAASQSGACGSGALDAGLLGITAAGHSGACGSGALDAGLCVGPEEKREEGPDENAGEDPYDIIHIPFFTIRPHTYINIYIYIYLYIHQIH